MILFPDVNGPQSSLNYLSLSQLIFVIIYFEYNFDCQIGDMTNFLNFQSYKGVGMGRAANLSYKDIFIYIVDVVTFYRIQNSKNSKKAFPRSKI